jgi:hypothetical protein
VATDVNSENGRNRMEASYVGKCVCVGTKEDESSTGRVWVPGFHHVRARSRLAGILKIINHLIR